MSLKPLEQNNLQPYIRWMKASDLDEIVPFDAYAMGKFAWDECGYRAALRTRNVIGTVYETTQDIRGVMVYQLRKSGLELLRFVVHPDYHRTGIGTSMVDLLKDKLSQQRRTWVEIDVPEIMLPAQLFFRSCGFQFTEFVRNGSNVEYRMRYQV